MARIPFPDVSMFSPQLNAAVATMPTPLNLVTMMAHSPALLPPAVELGMTILKCLRLSPRRREILILLVGAHVHCEYSQTQHVPMARAAGLSEQEVAAIVEEPQDFGVFPREEQLLLRAGTELLDEATLRAGTVEALRGEFSHQEIVELFFVVGHFRTLTGMLNGLQIDVDPKGDQFATVSSVPAYPQPVS